MLGTKYASPFTTDFAVQSSDYSYTRRCFSNEKRQQAVEDLTVETDTNVDEDIDRSKYTKEVEVRMPDMGDGDGRILEWFKKEGDIVKREDVLCDIETPDFTFGMETDDENLAIMGKICVEAPSEPIRDEEVICILLHENKDESKE